MNRKIIALLMSSLAILVILISRDSPLSTQSPLTIFYIKNSESMIQSPNVVTAIYLYFRYYDTLFEALMLLFSVTGIVRFSRLPSSEEEDSNE